MYPAAEEQVWRARKAAEIFPSVLPLAFMCSVFARWGSVVSYCSSRKLIDCLKCGGSGGNEKWQRCDHCEPCALCSSSVQHAQSTASNLLHARSC